MPEEVTLTRPVFEKLLEHLVYIEENIDEIIELHYPETEAERNGLQAYFSHYVRRIEEVLEKIRVVPHILKRDSSIEPIHKLNQFPFAIIGSTVALEDLETKEKLKYRIVYPFEHGTAYDISYLSTTAKDLLLKETGCDVGINTHEGKKEYRILSVSLD